MKRLFWICFLYFPTYLSAQKHDHIWQIGYNNNRHPTHKGTQLQFGQNGLILSPRLVESNVGVSTNTSICEGQSGDLRFFSNGYAIFDRDGNVLYQPLLFGRTLLHSTTYGLRTTQSGLFLPMPNNPDRYMYLGITMSQNFFPFRDINLYIAGDSLQYTIVEDNNNMRRVVALKQHLLKDTLNMEGIDACRHANGRDWWVFMPKDASNRYHRFLLNPQGIRYDGEQKIGDSTHYKYSFVQSNFSPNGEWWVRHCASSYVTGNTVIGYDVFLFRFDRCSGQLSRPLRFKYHQDTTTGGGAAFSPSGRYLYVTTNKQLYQYDLQAASIENSRQIVGTWDGFTDSLGWQTLFLHTRLASDNKIYISTATTTPYLHVIHAPDSAGMACRLEQRAIRLLTANRTLPFLPNYRTGRLVGSPCDTVRTSTTDLDTGGGRIWVYPNPTEGKIRLSWADVTHTQATELLLFDMVGKLVKQEAVPQGINELDLDLSDLPNGFYQYQIQFGTHRYTGKVAVAR